MAHKKVTSQDKWQPLKDPKIIIGYLSIAGILIAVFVTGYYIFIYDPPRRNIEYVLDTTSHMGKDFGSSSKFNEAIQAIKIRLDNVLHTKANVALRIFEGSCNNKVTKLLIPRFGRGEKYHNELKDELDSLKIDQNAKNSTLVKGALAAISDQLDLIEAQSRSNLIANLLAKLNITDMHPTPTYELKMFLGSLELCPSDGPNSITQNLADMDSKKKIKVVQYIALGESRKHRTAMRNLVGERGDVFFVKNSYQLMTALEEDAEVANCFFDAIDMYERGGDSAKIIEKFEKADSNDISEASVYLGQIFNERWGGKTQNEDDWKRAVRWYKRGDSLDNVGATISVGRMYKKKGQYSKAKPWFEKAERLGLPEATFNLAIIKLRSDIEAAWQLRKKAELHPRFELTCTLEREWDDELKIAAN